MASRTKYQFLSMAQQGAPFAIARMTFPASSLAGVCFALSFSNTKLLVCAKGTMQFLTLCTSVLVVFLAPNALGL